ncbi:sugar fermentation stimulation protein A [Anaerosolibacter carboniphilus]|uniref:Sugar fermentation stimulation protein homolog n=1 Tax=Anaerosolibacter carboniphilus TaxID=1417629 RepID=A0A841KN18_9FIRM|nr:DNA/RNA nuclease SfsA [Anaerosolibacter carboniphilus]MBB6214793.1 sugar fermentation stimulation protein A [Anaerosolibacter carboniphilus]
MKVHIEGMLHEAIFIKRINRFLAEIQWNDSIHKAHVPNTGRMKELLFEGARVIVRSIENEKRKTKFDLLMVYMDQGLVAIDSKLPNVILENAFRTHGIGHLCKYDFFKKEVQYGNSRIDLLLNKEKELAFIEAKCVTYVRDDHVASFPDAPTERGRKHVIELMNIVKENMRGVVIFVVQREDALYFTPNQERDPAFAAVVEEAAAVGVEFYAFTCKVSKNEVKIDKEIPVVLTHRKNNDNI